MLSELRRLAPVSNVIVTLRINRASLFYFSLFSLQHQEETSRAEHVAVTEFILLSQKGN